MPCDDGARSGARIGLRTRRTESPLCIWSVRMRTKPVRGKKATRRPARRRRHSRSPRPAAQRSERPTSTARPAKLTRDRTHDVRPPGHVRVIGGEVGARDRDRIARKLGTRFGKFGSFIERITVRLSDANGPKGGRDQICQIKVVLSGLPSVVVEERDSALQGAVDRAMHSAALAVRRSTQRRRSKPLRHRASPRLSAAP